MTGHKAIEEAHRQLIEQGIGIRPTTQEVEASGNMAYEIGTYAMVGMDGQRIDQGHYATVWKKEDGQCKIARDIISSTKVAPSEIDVTGGSVAKDHLYVELWSPKQAWLNLRTTLTWISLPGNTFLFVLFWMKAMAGHILCMA